MAPKVSIIVTCYNYGKYVVGCLESVKKQTFQDYEVIIVDDGSTDDSKQKIRPFLSDSRFMYVKQRNGGQANAKNRGIKESVGEFIAFLDADDMWDPDKLEKQLRLFQDDKVGVVYSRQKFIDEKGGLILPPRKRKTMLPKSGKVTSHLFMDNFVPFSSSIVRAKCFEEFGGFDESFAMGIDWDLWLRISTRYFFDYVDEPLLIYRVGHPGQMSKNTTKRHECSDRIMETFISNYPEEVFSSLLRAAMSFTYCNRGLFFSDHDMTLSNNYYMKAVKINPFQVRAYAGLLKNIVKK